ncbi:MAG TPA: EAL domain-containing protein [Azospirillaceae bacterium]|nr:EAL domain-containing protein [Azospirillaceae bacterium]
MPNHLSAEGSESDPADEFLISRRSDFWASLAGSLFDDSVFCIVYVDRDHRCCHANERYLTTLGARVETVVGRPFAQLQGPSIAEQVAALERATLTGTTAAMDCVYDGPDGAHVLLSGSFIPHRDDSGEVQGYAGFFQEVIDDLRVADFLINRDRFVTALLDAAVDGVIVSDHKGIIRAINRACCAMFGFEEGELLGHNLTVLMPPPYSDDHDRYMGTYLETARAKIIGIGRETMGRRRDGTVFPVHLSVGKTKLGNELMFVGIVRDISEKLEAERRAFFLARHDTLTGVLTRTAFFEECEHLLANNPADGNHYVAFYCLDVDQFSDVNEAYGFHVGDAALKALVARVAEVLPKDTLICRVAADEFAALARVSDPEYGRMLADVLHDRLTASIYAERIWVRLRLSVGAALFDRTSPHTVEEFNAKAKLALQAAQHNGGNAVSFYTPEMAAAATRRTLLTMHLAHAIERNELRVVYQPLVDAKTGRVVSAEALLRWWHKDLGAVSPAEFIPIAEECGLIIPITYWVLEDVVGQLAQWEVGGVLPERVFVNISGLLFTRGNLVRRLSELLAPYPGLRGRLGLEITEQAAVRDLKAAIRTITELSVFGIQAAIDDFGSGYSSLASVQQLPVSKLKIDRSFCMDVPENVRNNALVRAAVGMAHGLGLSVVAEGVETVEQHWFLQSVGCDMLQGYLFGYPMPPETFAAIIRDQQTQDRSND